MIPFEVGSIAVVANIPELVDNKLHLRLTQKTIVQIFDNTIKFWNDSRITDTNPTIKSSIPGQPIRRIVRLDSSGTTETFTASLAKFDSSWTVVSPLPVWPNE
jgi:ABC-type phosphate transport system substrate-binding protein